MQRQGNPKMSIVYCSASNKNNNICDTIPLYTSSNIMQISTTLPYITWGLIWDLKIRTEEIPNFFLNLIRSYFLTRLSSGIPKLRQGIQSSKLIESRLNSIIWYKLKFRLGEIPKVIYHVWDELGIKANKT